MENRYDRTLYRVLFSLTLILFICLGISVLNGCKGDSGPVGPAGPRGSGNVSMYTYSFTDADLVRGGSDSTYFYTSFTNPGIITAINNGAALFVYLGADTIWTPLPYTEPHAPALSIGYYLYNQYLFLEVITSYGDARNELIAFLNSNSYQLRIVVIPANNVYLSKIVAGKTSFNEIKTMLNLQNF